MSLPQRPDRDREQRKAVSPVLSQGADRLDFVAMGWRPWLLLTLLCLTLYLPGSATMPPVDRDESRFAQATRQMIENHDYVRIHYQDTARNQKPAAIYWLQSASVSLFSNAESTAIWPYRLISVLGALGAVLGLFAVGAQLFDRRTGLVAAAFLATSLNLVVESHIATTDALLLSLVVAAQGLLARAYLAHRRSESFGLGLAIGFWVFEGLAILVKGPVLPILSLLSVAMLVVLDRRGTWLKSLRAHWGVPLVAIIVLPWLYMVQNATHGAFLHDSFGTDFLGKVGEVQQAHGAPPGYYLLTSQITMWPMTLFEGLAAIWAWRHRRLQATRMALAWLIPFWIAAELVQTKLPHYILPAYPAAALLAARAMLAYAEEGFHPKYRAWILVPAVSWSLAGLALGGFSLYLAINLDWNAPTCFGVVIILAGMMATSWQFWHQQRAHHQLGSVLLTVAASTLLVVPSFGMLLPNLGPLWVSREARQLVDTVRLPGEGVAAVGYAEPSLVFLLGTNTLLTNADEAAAAMAARKIALVLVEKSSLAEFDKAATSHHLFLHALGSVAGRNYSNGHKTVLTLYRSDTSP